MNSGLAGGLPFVARVALLACVGGLAFVLCVFGGFLLCFLLAYAFLTFTSLCNTLTVAADGCRCDFAWCLVDQGALVNDAGGCCQVSQQLQVPRSRRN